MHSFKNVKLSIPANIKISYELGYDDDYRGYFKAQVHIGEEMGDFKTGGSLACNDYVLVEFTVLKHWNQVRSHNPES